MVAKHPQPANEHRRIRFQYETDSGISHADFGVVSGTAPNSPDGSSCMQQKRQRRAGGFDALPAG